METCFNNLNGKKLIIGLIHLLPMPGTPNYKDGNMEKMLKKAVQDARTLKANGADGCLIQPGNSIYPCTDDTDYIRVACLAAAISLVRAEVGPDFLIGGMLMVNCTTPSLAACKAAGADFTRVAALARNTESPWGTVIAQPLKVADYRNKIEANNIAMIAEVSSYHHKHSEFDPAAIRQQVRSSLSLGANAVEIMDPDFEHNERLVKLIKEMNPDIPVVLGGGTNVENCKDRLRYADVALVGTCFEGGKWGGPVIGEIVAEYVRKVRELEAELAAEK